MSTPKKRRVVNCLMCPTKIRPSDGKSGLCRSCFDTRQQKLRDLHLPPAEHVLHDRELTRVRSNLGSLQAKYDEARRQIETLERDFEAANAIEAGLETHVIEPKKGSKTSEGTAVLVASDWHIEERVNLATVSGLNEYSLDIARRRATKFFSSGLRLVKLLQQDIEIKTLVLPLLGDFITNELHDAESAELNEVQPIHAIIEAENLIASGIDFVLKTTDLEIVLPCHSGNHARTTKKTRFSSENGHSLEFLMYRHLANVYRDNARVKFVVPDGYHSYVQVYDRTVRFHHGHAINYQGGIGGIFIPAFKAISQWDKARRADLDVFGHFHQHKDGGKFVSNGSLIGYNGFALSIKADFEPPRQTLFLIDKKRGRTCTWPVMF